MLSARPINDLQLAIPVTLQKLVAIALLGTLELRPGCQGTVSSPTPTRHFL
jgi:hypothetical protein